MNRARRTHAVSRNHGGTGLPRQQREATGPAMSDALAARLTALGTGGPKDDREEWFQHLLGWSLTVLVAVLVTRLGLM